MADTGVNVHYRVSLLVALVALVLLAVASITAVTLLASSDRVTLALSTITALLAPTIGVIALNFKAEKIEATAAAALEQVNGHGHAIEELKAAVGEKPTP